MTVRELTQARIMEVLEREIPALHGIAASAVADQVVLGLEALLAEQEGFVPVENPPSGENPVFDFEGDAVEITVTASELLSADPAGVCPSCHGTGGYSTPSMLGLDDHVSPCVECDGSGKIKVAA